MVNIQMNGRTVDVIDPDSENQARYSGVFRAFCIDNNSAIIETYHGKLNIEPLPNIVFTDCQLFPCYQCSVPVSAGGTGKFIGNKLFCEFCAGQTMDKQ